MRSVNSLATSANRPLQLGGEPDNYPITELLGRLLWFRSRVRLARALIVLARAAFLCALVLLIAKTTEVITREPMTGWLPSTSMVATVTPVSARRQSSA